MHKAVVYTRISRTLETSTSLERQERDARAWAAANDHEIVRVLADDGISGRVARANADAALEMLRTGAADTLVVWAFDRFSRLGLRALVELLDALDARPGARFVALSNGLDSTAPTWRLIAGVLAEVGRIEAANTSARVTSSIDALRRAGRFSGGVVPFGYRSTPAPDGPGRVLTLDAAEVATLREAAALILDERRTPHAVARILNERGTRPRRADKWTRTAVVGVLTSPASVGRVTHRGEVLRGPDGLPAEVWPPALDLATWRALRDVLAPAPDAAHRRRRAARLLSGVLVCADGETMHVQASRTRGTVAYRCHHADGTPGMTIAADAVEAAVTAALLSAAGHLPIVAPEDGAAREAAAAALADATADLDALALALRDADEDDLPPLLARRTALRASIAGLRAEVDAAGPAALAPTGETLADVWAAAPSLDARRALLLSAIDHVLVKRGRAGRHGIDPARLDIRWRN